MRRSPKRIVRTGSAGFPRMPWYPRDFRSSTLTWPLIAKGAYRELLDAQWDAGGSNPGILPDDPERLQMLAGATAAEWKVAWPLIEPKFPQVLGGRRNPKLEQHREEAIKHHQRNHERAVVAVRARIAKQATKRELEQHSEGT